MDKEISPYNLDEVVERYEAEIEIKYGGEYITLLPLSETAVVYKYTPINNSVGYEYWTAIGVYIKKGYKKVREFVVIKKYNYYNSTI